MVTCAGRRLLRVRLTECAPKNGLWCQSARKKAPLSASNFFHAESHSGARRGVHHCAPLHLGPECRPMNPAERLVLADAQPPSRSLPEYIEDGRLRDAPRDRRASIRCCADVRSPAGVGDHRARRPGRLRRRGHGTSGSGRSRPPRRISTCGRRDRGWSGGVGGVRTRQLHRTRRRPGAHLRPHVARLGQQRRADRATIGWRRLCAAVARNRRRKASRQYQNGPAH
jgi:hypothetical protein